MPLQPYADAYLAGQCTDDREFRATRDVDDIAPFAPVWRDRLIVLRTYIIACLECQADADDLFAAKLKHYRVEFDRVLAQARAATTDASGRPMSVFAVQIDRG